MDKEEIKNRINFNRIGEKEFIDPFGDSIKRDYIFDVEGHAIQKISPVEYKLIEKIKELEDRISTLEGAKLQK